MDKAGIDAKLNSFEARLHRLEARSTADASASEPPRAEKCNDGVTLAAGWPRRLDPGKGGVVYTGRYIDPAGAELRWQIGRPQQSLLDEDWSDLAPRLVAWGHRCGSSF